MLVIEINIFCIGLSEEVQKEKAGTSLPSREMQRWLGKTCCWWWSSHRSAALSGMANTRLHHNPASIAREVKAIDANDIYMNIFAQFVASNFLIAIEFVRSKFLSKTLKFIHEPSFYGHEGSLARRIFSMPAFYSRWWWRWWWRWLWVLVVLNSEQCSGLSSIC